MNDRKTRVERFDSLPSTNDYAKSKRSNGENLIIIANSQSGGRGTKGRSFSSKSGGVYLSRLTFYQNFPAKDAFKIMQSAAVAVCKTLEDYALFPKIKWPNDVLVNGKKICGILIENTFQGNLVHNAIVGVGLNVNNVLEEELKEIATTMSLELGKPLPLAEVEEKLLCNLSSDNSAEEYAKYLAYVNETVALICGEKRIEATPLFVDETGNLVAKTKSGVETFSAAEISLRKD